VGSGVEKDDARYLEVGFGAGCGYRGCMGYSYDGVDLREHPEKYRIGRGEQGVFHAEPYKGELLPLWSFKDEEAARQSSEGIYKKFLEYRSAGDFVGMDVARKYLQMGWTRSLRYAKYKGGDKSRPREGLDSEKSRGAEVYRRKWRAAAEDEEYLRLKEEHKRRNE
jgi:hypothetical protein